MSNKPDDNSQDPFNAWREFLAEEEKNINDCLSKVMATPQYTAASQGVLNALLRSQSTFQKMTQRYFETVNLATRKDVAAIIDRLNSIEHTLSRLEKSSTASAGEDSTVGAATPKPKRTRTLGTNRK